MASGVSAWASMATSTASFMSSTGSRRVFEHWPWWCAVGRCNGRAAPLIVAGSTTRPPPYPARGNPGQQVLDGVFTRSAGEPTADESTASVSLSDRRDWTRRHSESSTIRRDGTSECTQSDSGRSTGAHLPQSLRFRPAPNDDASVTSRGRERADGARRPASDRLQAVDTTRMLGCRCALGIESLGDALEPEPCVKREDLHDDGGFGGIDDTLDVGAQWPTVRVDTFEDVDVAVAEDTTAHHLAGVVESGVRLVDACGGGLAMRLVSEPLHSGHDLVEALRGVSDVRGWTEIPTPASASRLMVYAVSLASRPMDFCSETMRTENGGRGSSASIRWKPGRFSNSAPEMPSSTRCDYPTPSSREQWRRRERCPPDA